MLHSNKCSLFIALVSKALPFLAPGAPDKGRLMALEIVAKLPHGAKAMIEVPLVFFELLRECHQFGKVTIDEKRHIAIIPVNPQGRIHFGEVLFPAKSRHALRLLVHIPEEHRQRTYRVMARQLWEQEEVGRVTWQLQPKSYV